MTLDLNIRSWPPMFMQSVIEATSQAITDSDPRLIAIGLMDIRSGWYDNKEKGTYELRLYCYVFSSEYSIITIVTKQAIQKAM